MVNPLSFCFFFFSFLVSSCYYARPKATQQIVERDTAALDSATFVQTHHYWKGYNFTIADSIVVQTTLPLHTALAENVLEDMGVLSDSFSVRAPKQVVVADLRYTQAASQDTVWIKIATEDAQTGWIREGDLLQQAIPDNSISRFIFHFSRNNVLLFLTLGTVALALVIAKYQRRKRWHIVHWNDIRSFYPTALCLATSIAAALYGIIQAETPQDWVEFYFHPTLNPFSPSLPFFVQLFLFSFWTLIILGTATLEEFYRRPEIRHRLVYLSTLLVVCALLYIVFTVSMRFYIGYPLLFLYWAFALHRYHQQGLHSLRCGHCKEALPKLGRCPSCNAMNE